MALLTAPFLYGSYTLTSIAFSFEEPFPIFGHPHQTTPTCVNFVD